MTDAIVDISLSWECNTLLDFLFLLINFISLLNNHIVTDFAKFKGRDTKNASLNQVFQDTKMIHYGFVMWLGVKWNLSSAMELGAPHYTVTIDLDSHIDSNQLLYSNVAELEIIDRVMRNPLYKLTSYRLAMSPAILYFVTTKSLAMVNSSLSDSESDIFRVLDLKTHKIISCKTFGILFLMAVK